MAAENQGRTGRTESENPNETVAAAEAGTAPGASGSKHAAGPQAPASDAGDAAEEAGGASPDKPAAEDLEGQLERARAEAREQREATLRANAELENQRKRAARDLENAHKFGVERLVSEFLPVKDSLELGLEASRKPGADLDSVRQGLELTLKMFDQAGEKLGLSAVDPLGEAFDPDYHEAMSMQESADAESGTVISVYQKGYLLHDRLVRPALVVVAK